MILDGFQKETPFSTEQLQFRWTVHYPRMTLTAVSRQSDVVLNNKALQISHLPWPCLWIWMALKIKSLFPQNNLIQIDSPLPQDDTQVVFKTIYVVLNNKSSPNLIFHVFWSVILDGFQKKLPVPQNNFNSDWQSTTPGWHSSSFQTIWCCINNKSSPNLTFYLTAFDFEWL